MPTGAVLVGGGDGIGVAGGMKGRTVAVGVAVLLIAAGGMLLGVATAAPQHAAQPGAAQGRSTRPAAPVQAAGPAAADPTRPPEQGRRISGVRGQVMPTGVPASQVGKLLVNDTGDNLASWPRQARGGGSGSISHSDGMLHLSTSGANANGYSIISPKTYTSGIFEARLYFPGARDGKIADWPAFWLSSAWAHAVPFPAGGEMDLAEGMRGNLYVDYHYGVNGTPKLTKRWSVTSAPGWHVVTGVWTSGRWDVYYDGGLVKTISGSYVVNAPMNVILTAYQGSLGDQPGVPSTLEVSYLRIWRLASS